MTLRRPVGARVWRHSTGHLTLVTGIGMSANSDPRHFAASRLNGRFSPPEPPALEFADLKDHVWLTGRAIVGCFNWDSSGRCPVFSRRSPVGRAANLPGLKGWLAVLQRYM